MNENKNASELNKALEGLWDSLTDEQKEKAKACKTLDELTALAGKEGVELPDELLDAVAGGFIFRVPESGKWEVVSDKDGSIIDVGLKNASEARLLALCYFHSTKELTREQLEQLRAHPGSIKKC